MKDQLEAFIQQITREAGDAILPMYGNIGVKRTKLNAGDMVTDADLLAEKIIVEAIRKQYPDHGIVAEEEDALNENAEWVWYIDPVDGTRNFATATPHWGVMVGLAHNKVMQFACIYLPVTNDFCFAAKGKGTHHNGCRVQCSQTAELAYSYGVTTAFLRPVKLPAVHAIIDIAQTMPFNLNMIGSIAVSAIYLATGRRDWYVSVQASVWDYAAPSLILEEAGCVLTNADGTPWELGTKGFIAANEKLHKELLGVLKQ